MGKYIAFVSHKHYTLAEREEVGRMDRFPTAEHLASYAGTTPCVHASGGKVRYGLLRPDVNRTLKWAFAEAANAVAVHHARQT